MKTKRAMMVRIRAQGAPSVGGTRAPVLNHQRDSKSPREQGARDAPMGAAPNAPPSYRGLITRRASPWLTSNGISKRQPIDKPAGGYAPSGHRFLSERAGDRGKAGT